MQFIDYDAISYICFNLFISGGYFCVPRLSYFMMESPTTLF